ncbi:MAG: choice-of-anchor J domain-containing protein, partial [Bacteroidales bacterium]|nr:choice-of-anchor J domain-containing protein [Bacteroidales bacterium]
MRKLILTLIFSIIGIWGFSQSNQNLTSSDTANYPYWQEMMQDRSINFYQTQRAFNLYWENRTPAKGTGYKVFKRWENFWINRINPDGTFPSPDRDVVEYQQFNSNPSKGLMTSSGGSWTELGPVALPYNGTGQPNGLGRVNAIAFHPTNANIIYVGAPSGGLWKTSNGGSTWASLTDGLPSLGVSSIIIDPTNTNTIYLGTGDRDGGDAPGIGVYKSIDGGVNWSVANSGMGNRTVNQMIMHPSNNSLILAATSGGVYKTVNAGVSWTLVSTASNFKDIVFKPGDPTTVYGAVNNYFYKSTNTGDSWTNITSGLPTSGRFVIGVSAANANYVYVVVGNSSGFVGAYRSTNSGTSFTTMSTSPNILGYEADGSGSASQAFYDLCIAVDPTNINTIYVGGINIWKSTNGGTSWTINAHWVGTNAPNIHADQHWLGFSPVNGRLYNGNDGGVYYTTNGGSSWIDNSSGLAIAQVYRIGQSALSKNQVINGYQDNGTAIYKNGSWSTEIGGDGMECIVDYTDTNYLYGALYYGDIRRSTNGGTYFYAIADNGLNGINESGAWVTPYTLNSSNANIMYIGYKNVWRSTNVKTSSTSSIVWTKISTFGTSTNLSDIESSPADANILYVSRGSQLFRTDNANATTPTWATLSASNTISDIKAHPTNSNIVYITAGTNIYKSTNKGSSWTSIKGNLPTVSMNTLIIDKNANEGIYVGTDVGVFYKDATMTNWVSFSTGLPPAAEITELEIHYATNAQNSVIRAATYGRGLWSSDLYSNPAIPPVADFNASLTTPCLGQYITFNDLSTNSPTTWQWTFSPSTITYATGSSATSQHPVVKFNAAGNYTVTLYASNAYGNDTIIKTGYINVGTPYTAPVTENFESFTVGNPGTFANGWSFSNTGTFNWRVNNGGTATVASGPNADHTTGTSNGKYLYTEASNPAAQGEIANLISPCVLIPSSATNYQLSFWYHMYGQDITGLHVDIFHNGNWINDIYTLTGQQQTSNSSSWLMASIPLGSYAGNTIQIRFRVIRGNSFDGDVAIDDVSIGLPGIPVANFTASTTSTYTGTPVTFADASTNTPTSWNWTITPSTFSYTSGTSSSSQNPVVVFNSGGSYTIKLKVTNAVGSDSLTKTNYININAGYTLPFTENFQSFTVGTPGSLSNGWTSQSTGNYPWTVNSGGTPSNYTGPLNDHTLGTSSGIYMFTEASSAGTGNTAMLISPTINMTSVSNAELKFWYHMHGAYISALYVEIEVNSTWTTIQTITGQQQTQQTDPWLQASINLQAYAGNNVRIRFRTISNGDYRNDIAIDDITIQQVTPPINDNPCGALSLTVGTSCNLSTFTNVNSTPTTTVPNPPCGGYNGQDVWFKFIAPASGFAVIDAEQSTGSFADGAMAVYKGSCTNLTYLNCSDDYNGNGNMPNISLTGLTSGDTIFVRFWEYGGNLTGNFQLCVYEPPYISITPTNQIVSSSLGSTTFSVSSNQYWTASDNAGWVVISPTSSNGSGTITANYSANAGAVRTATITVTNGLGITKTATLTQLSNVVANFSTTSNYLCQGTSTTFTNTSTNNTTNQWFINGALTSSSSNLTYTFNAAGTHVVKLLVSNGTNSDSISKIYYVSTPPSAYAGQDTTLCATGTIQLKAAYSTGVVACTTNCSMPTYCASASQNDNFEFISKVQIGSSINSSSNAGVGYENYSSSVFTILTKDSTTNLYVTGYINGATPYLEYVDAYIDWNRNGIFDEPSISMGSATYTGAHIFTGIVTVPNNAVVGKTIMRVILKYNGSIASGCENSYGYGETEDYMIEIVDIGETNYAWSGPSSFSANSRAASLTNVTTSNSGTYTLTVTDGFGCADTDQKTVTVIATPNVTFATLNPVCIGSSSITLTQGSPSGGTYFGTGVSGNQFNPNTAGIGTHTLYYSYTNSNGCSDTASQTITVNPLPTVTLTTPTSSCINGSLITLSGGLPSGGTYSGLGVSGGVFNPAIAGLGNKT